jgi:hypothetical protein
MTHKTHLRISYKKNHVINEYVIHIWCQEPPRNNLEEKSSSKTNTNRT